MSLKLVPVALDGHAPLPPSSAHLWRHCAGWRRMQELAEPLTEDMTRAAEGTAAHWAVSEVLSGRQVDVGVIAASRDALVAPESTRPDVPHAHVTVACLHSSLLFRRDAADLVAAFLATGEFPQSGTHG